MNVSSIILWINCKQLSSITVENEINRLFTIQVLKRSQTGLNMNKICLWINQAIIVKSMWTFSIYMNNILRFFRYFMNIKNIGVEYE